MLLIYMPRQIHAQLRATFRSGVTRPLEWRKQQIRQMVCLLQENKTAIEHAVWQDLRKPAIEAVISEVFGIVKNCQMVLDELEQWAAATKPPVHPSHTTWNATIHAVPKGVVLIISYVRTSASLLSIMMIIQLLFLFSPWNYPFTLTLKPLVGAIAAGCAAVIKPSEISAHSAALIASLVPRYLDTSAYAVVTGAVPETTALLDLRWDHILYTGGGIVGRIVAAAAAKNLTPLTLELGGKSPVLIDTDCNVEIAAKRILYGKSQNAGQVQPSSSALTYLHSSIFSQLCVIPDYVLVPRAIYAAFLDSLKKAYELFWPEGPFHPTAQWGKVISERHADRLINLMEKTKGQLLVGGAVIRKDGITQIAPTVYFDVPLDDALMEE